MWHTTRLNASSVTARGVSEGSKPGSSRIPLNYFPVDPNPKPSRAEKHAKNFVHRAIFGANTAEMAYWYPSE